MLLHLTSTILFLALSACAFDISQHPFQAPLPTDLRGPCPALNTLANHGFISRNGMNLTVASVLQASIDGFNVQNDILTLAAKIGQMSTSEPDTFTLADIRLHNAIEHDASLSRNDFALGPDNFHFNETIFTTLANSNPGVDFYNATSAGLVMRQRLADSENRNPSIINTARQFSTRSGESSLYLSIMGDPLTGVAPKEFVQIFFREERMPIAEGWTRVTTPITLTTLGPIISILQQVADWSPSNVGECTGITVASGPPGSTTTETL